MTGQSGASTTTPRWDRFLDIALVIWVLRVPVAWATFGFAVLLLPPQAQDLLVNTADNITDGSYGTALAFLVVLTLVWAAPSHYVSRLLLDSDVRFQARVEQARKQRNAGAIVFAEEWLPRALGLAAFVAIFFACRRAMRNLPELGDVTRAAEFSIYVLMAAVALFGAIFLLYVLYRERISNTGLLKRVESFAAPPMNGLRWLLSVITRVPSKRSPDHERQLGPLLLIAMIAAFCFVPLICPAWIAEIVPLAFFVPFVIGGWMPLLAWLSAIGRRLRAPIITTCIALAWIVPYIVGEGYVVRQIKDTAQQIRMIHPDWNAVNLPEKEFEAKRGQLRIGDAVKYWIGENCPNDINKCPRPIIVAASGGASRAGFFTASVLGALLDNKIHADLANAHNLSPNEVRKRLFAISSVSGSSVGAIVTVAALAAAPHHSSVPCGNARATYWHGREIANWRDCLEALTSGDFLTPVFAGFMFRDVLRNSLIEDRAALLERSWDNHFKSLVSAPKVPLYLACEGSLECPFRTLRPTDKRWLPILVLNGTSVETGQRIVTTILDWDASNKGPDGKSCERQGYNYSCPLFLNSFLYHWLANSTAPERDITISTAAHNSARFPFISPPGEVYGIDMIPNEKNPSEKPKEQKVLRDRIVDGGYFENYGILSAIELAAAIQAVEPKLAPFVLVLTNDPDIPIRFDPMATTSTGKRFAVDIFGPVNAIMNARSADGYLAVIGIEQELKLSAARSCEKNSAYIRVWPIIRPVKSGSQQGIEVADFQRPVSMSWWLSRPVQRYLNSQIGSGKACEATNFACRENAKEVEVLRVAMAADYKCKAPDDRPRETPNLIRDAQSKDERLSPMFKMQQAR